MCLGASTDKYSALSVYSRAMCKGSNFCSVELWHLVINTTKKVPQLYMTKTWAHRALCMSCVFKVRNKAGSIGLLFSNIKIKITLACLHVNQGPCVKMLFPFFFYKTKRMHHLFYLYIKLFIFVLVQPLISTEACHPTSIYSGHSCRVIIIICG